MDFIKYFPWIILLLWLKKVTCGSLEIKILNLRKGECCSSFRHLKKCFVKSFVPNFDLMQKHISWRSALWSTNSNLVIIFAKEYRFSSPSCILIISIKSLSSEWWPCLMLLSAASRSSFLSCLLTSSMHSVSLTSILNMKFAIMIVDKSIAKDPIAVKIMTSLISRKQFSSSEFLHKSSMPSHGTEQIHWSVYRCRHACVAYSDLPRG